MTMARVFIIKGNSREQFSVLAGELGKRHHLGKELENEDCGTAAVGWFGIPTQLENDKRQGGKNGQPR